MTAPSTRLELEDVFRAHQQAVVAYFFRVMGNRQDAVCTGTL